MSTDELKKYLHNLHCLPHQVAFAEDFLAAKSARKQMLISFPGLGKGFVGSAIIGYAATHGLADKVLVLAPPGLIAQWSEMIRRKAPDLATFVVDRPRLRELEASQDANSTIWPATGVVLMSIDLARQEDVKEKLLRTTWDLLVVEEAQHLTPGTQRHIAVARLCDHLPDMRVLLLRVHPLIGSEWDAEKDPLLSDAAITIWSRETVRDNDGNAVLPEVHIKWINHHRSKTEVQLLSQLQDIVRSIAPSEPQDQLAATIVLQQASSSLFALEQRLNRMQQQRNEIVHGGFSESSHDEGEVQTLSDSERPATTHTVFQSELIDQSGGLLSMLEDVDSDSKFESLLALLRDIGVFTNETCRVCLFTSFVDTATYLESALSEHPANVNTITGSMSFAEREQVVASFAEKGGILIATSAMATMIPEVAAVIFYDLPLYSAVLDARIGQFIRIGRSDPIRIFAFADESKVLTLEELLRKMVDLKQPIDKGELQQLLFSSDGQNANGSQ